MWYQCRRAHVEAVAASVRSAPALSLRARAAALRVPRTTLRTILAQDLPAQPLSTSHSARGTATSYVHTEWGIDTYPRSHYVTSAALNRTRVLQQ